MAADGSWKEILNGEEDEQLKKERKKVEDEERLGDEGGGFPGLRAARYVFGALTDEKLIDKLRKNEADGRLKLFEATGDLGEMYAEFKEEFDEEEKKKQQQQQKQEVMRREHHGDHNLMYHFGKDEAAEEDDAAAAAAQLPAVGAGGFAFHEIHGKKGHGDADEAGGENHHGHRRHFG